MYAPCFRSGLRADPAIRRRGRPARQGDALLINSDDVSVEDEWLTFAQNRVEEDRLPLL
jgi:hypothetical protein